MITGKPEHRSGIQFIDITGPEGTQVTGLRGFDASGWVIFAWVNKWCGRSFVSDSAIRVVWKTRTSDDYPRRTVVNSRNTRTSYFGISIRTGGNTRTSHFGRCFTRADQRSCKLTVSCGGCIRTSHFGICIRIRGATRAARRNSLLSRGARRNSLLSRGARRNSLLNRGLRATRAARGR